ncbi:protein kinase [Actinoallomurus sp. NPDC052308]|uniref:serine/threonine-protein kinase n=1 Tax=Actinoallomurus sp. NPDC052308 TaxID=3155530 RepID=UPI00344AA1A6
MPLGEGFVLGHRYRLLSHIGRGGMGTVWHAHDDLLARDVAVKEVLFPPGLSEDEHKVMYERTLREARSAARLNHPGIVTVHDVVEEDGRPCIVMEFVRARSLQEVIDEDGPLPPAQVAEIGAQVLAALRTAHAAGITHRDVKPANVLLAGAADEPVSRSTRVVITDFGIATMEGDSTLTQTGLIMGSPAYIAPERARGDKASPASDLWALGATLYAAVEGQSPHHRPEAMAALTSVISEEAPPPRNAGALAPVLMGLLDKDPARRLTADEAAAGLTRAAQGTRPLPAPGPATGGNGADPGHERPPAPWRLAAEAPPPPSHPSAAMADPGAGGRAHGPATVKDPAPSGAARPDSSGPPPGVTGPMNSAGAAQDETWMRSYDRPGQAPAAAGRGARTVVVAVGAVLVVAALAVALLLYFSRDGHPSAKNTHPPTASQSTKPSQSSAKGTPSPRNTIPAGYHQVTAQDGSTLMVPKGWQHTINGPRSEKWQDHRTGNHIQLDTIPWGTDDPVKHWQMFGKDAPQNLSGFQWVVQPHPETVHGAEGANAEYSWNYGKYGKVYAFDSGFAVGTQQYSLMSAGGNPGAAAVRFDKALASFHPGGR